MSELEIAVALFFLIIFLCFVISILMSAGRYYIENIDTVKSWNDLQKVGSVTILSVKEIDDCSKTEVVICLANDFDRQIAFEEPNVVALDKEGFLFNDWCGTNFKGNLPRNSKERISMIFLTKGRAIDKVRIWNQDIQITPNMFLYEE
jgi:hypothetical protein